MIGRECMKRRILEGNKLEWTGLILFAIAYIVISAFHEPWFDEGQAWQIAKCASLREILFEIPHYEGHPPLWHLILAIPAKLGVPFEIGLKTVGCLFCTASVVLLLFHSRLPRFLRLSLPFTYFFFYQYGVIVRPYGLMLLILLLLGMELSERNDCPWRIALLLGGLCFTSAYGILFAGGIAICIVCEILRDKGLKRFLVELLRDSKTVSLLFLLVWAILLIWEIWPAEDTFGMNIQSGTSLPLRIFCAFFTFPSDCFLTTSSWFAAEQVSMQAMKIPITQLILCAVLGLILWGGIVCASSRRGVKFILVPYVLHAVFAAAVYFSTHHLGIMFLLTLFWAEYNCRDSERFEIGKALAARIAKNERDTVLIRRSGFILLIACVIIPLYWSVAASIHEIQFQYCSARSVASFLHDKGLDTGQRVFAMWGYGGSLFAEAEGHEDYICTDLIGRAVPLNAYFDHNIIINLNEGKDEEAYLHLKVESYEKSRTTVNNWQSEGIPDAVLGYPNLEFVFGDTVTPSDYTCIYKENVGSIWKNMVNRGKTVIYIRNDLLEQFGLEAVDDQELRYWYEGFSITDEMREAFENGVPIEEILKPYMDAMFGAE